MENTNNSITAVATLEGDIVSVVDDTYRIIVGSEQTSGAYALVDMLIPSDFQTRYILVDPFPCHNFSFTVLQ
jgi:hypothetical protein